MAEGFEAYNVPQQSRRDKLRVVANNHPQPDPLYPDFIKEEQQGLNFMNFAGVNNHMYADSHLTVHPTIQDIYASYQPFRNDAVYKPSPHSLSLSLNLPLQLNLQRYDNSSVFNATIVSGNGGAVSTVPLGPFTGYAAVLRWSRFLKPAQQLLEELYDVERGIYAVERNEVVDSSLLDAPPLEGLNGGQIVDGCGDQTKKKSRLLSMLDEVYKRYKQYYQQMQAAIAAFESLAGLSNTAPFANLALKAVSKQFKCLKNAITDQLHFTSKSQGKINSDGDETRLESSYGQRPFHVDQPPVWRPQRGLPERAVTVLRAWLFEHFLHPYPTDTDKIMLAKQTGLSRNQVSNWFINARVRLWKPMVEEIHMLETRQSQNPSQMDQDHLPNDHLPSSSSVECENALTSVPRIRDFPLKRGREDDSNEGSGAIGQMKMPYDNLLHHNHQIGVGLSNSSGGNGGVSLTLGLHQNVVGLSDSYPLNAARRFGLDSNGEGYVVSGFAAQNRQFGRDVIDGQIIHDFVG